MPEWCWVCSKQGECPWPKGCNCSNFLTKLNFSTSSSLLQICFTSPTQPCFPLQSCTYLLLYLGVWFKNLPFSFLLTDTQGTINIIATWSTKLNSDLKRARGREEKTNRWLEYLWEQATSQVGWMSHSARNSDKPPILAIRNKISHRASAPSKTACFSSAGWRAAL